MIGVILYGPPAAGKDTVTTALVERCPRFEHFHRAKHGPGRTAGYRMITKDILTALRAEGVLWENERYGATYLVDRAGLNGVWRAGRVPVVHLGQPEAVEAVTAGVRDALWFIVELHSPLSVLQRRISARGTGDEGERLRIAQRTPRLPRPSMSIDTSLTSPSAAARMIESALHELGH